METKEILLRDNGTLIERTTRERELDQSQAVLEALTGNVTRITRQVLSLPEWGPVHGNIGSSNTLWTVAINRIPLNARFRLVHDLIVPAFESKADIDMPLTWQAPKEVRLAFAILTHVKEGRVWVDGNWLFAIDAHHRGYRLPLPNLHDDCRICTGNFERGYDSASEAISASFEQFRKSKWNSDLMRTVEQSQKFFRFHPTNDTFETLPIEASDWTTLCDKVSTDLMERVVL